MEAAERAVDPGEAATEVERRHVRLQQRHAVAHFRRLLAQLARQRASMCSARSMPATSWPARASGSSSRPVPQPSSSSGPSIAPPRCFPERDVADVGVHGVVELCALGRPVRAVVVHVAQPASGIVLTPAYSPWARRSAENSGASSRFASPAEKASYTEHPCAARTRTAASNSSSPSGTVTRSSRLRSSHTRSASWGRVRARQRLGPRRRTAVDRYHRPALDVIDEQLPGLGRSGLVAKPLHANRRVEHAYGGAHARARARSPAAPEASRDSRAHSPRPRLARTRPRSAPCPRAPAMRSNELLLVRMERRRATYSATACSTRELRLRPASRAVESSSSNSQGDMATATFFLGMRTPPSRRAFIPFVHTISRREDVQQPPDLAAPRCKQRGATPNGMAPR